MGQRLASKVDQDFSTTRPRESLVGAARGRHRPHPERGNRAVRHARRRTTRRPQNGRARARRSRRARASMTGTELPTGDELVPHLDGYDDDLLAAYVRGLLEHFELKPASLDPYDPTTLSDFAGPDGAGPDPSRRTAATFRRRSSSLTAGSSTSPRTRGSRRARAASRRTTRTTSGTPSSSPSEPRSTPTRTHGRMTSRLSPITAAYMGC
jgi:hypothetical protein